MRHLARSKYRVTWFQPYLLLSDFHSHLATFEKEKPLLLLVMHMSRRSTTYHVSVFHNEDAAVSFAG